MKKFLMGFVFAILFAMVTITTFATDIGVASKGAVAQVATELGDADNQMILTVISRSFNHNKILSVEALEFLNLYGRGSIAQYYYIQLGFDYIYNGRDVRLPKRAVLWSKLQVFRDKSKLIGNG